MDTQQTFIKLSDDIGIPISDDLDITEELIIDSLHDEAQRAIQSKFGRMHPGHELVSVAALDVEAKHHQTDEDFLMDRPPIRYAMVRVAYVMTDPGGVYQSLANPQA